MALAAEDIGLEAGDAVEKEQAVEMVDFMLNGHRLEPLALDDTQPATAVGVPPAAWAR